MAFKQCEWSRGVRCSSESCIKTNELGFAEVCKYYKNRFGHNKYRPVKSVVSGRSS
jgi:hypothetical protein